MERPAADVEGCRQAHAQLSAAIDEITDSIAERPSLLPGWTVGHVMTRCVDQRDRARGCAAGLAAALETELNTCLAKVADQRDERGRRLVVRNGYHAARTVATAADPMPVKAPLVNDKRIEPDTGERHRSTPTILPAWVRTTPTISGVLLLYLHGLSTGDSVPALEQSLGWSNGTRR